MKKEDDKKYLKESYHTMPSTLDEWIDRELERCRKGHEGGNVGALKDVLYYCNEHKKTLPQWAVQELCKITNNSISGIVEKRKGRHPTWIKQYRQDMKDFIRADTVQECLEHDIDWDGVYIAASELLKGTFAEGSEHTIEKSYKRYKQRTKENPYRYMILYDSLLRIPDLYQPFTPERAESLQYVKSLRRKK